MLPRNKQFWNPRGNTFFAECHISNAISIRLARLCGMVVVRIVIVSHWQKLVKAVWRIRPRVECCEQSLRWILLTIRITKLSWHVLSVIVSECNFTSRVSLMWYNCHEVGVWMCKNVSLKWLSSIDTAPISNCSNFLNLEVKTW